MPKNFESILGRRDFLKLSGAVGTSLLLSRTSGSLIQSAYAESKRSDFLRNHSPINRLVGDHAPRKFSGDDNTRPHQILWDIPNYLSTKKITKKETTELVIIGGGVSGLFTAYQHRKHKPIILEQAPRFGGNAKGESFRGLDYSIGAAYIDQPHAGTPMAELYQELGIAGLTVTRPDPDPVEHKGKLYRNFWAGEVEPSDRKAYEAISKHFQDLVTEKNHAFPWIPSLKKENWEAAKRLDQESLHAALSRVAGGKLPPALETAIEHYSWSTYAASSKELSAPIAYMFLAQESNPIRIASGGNSAIAERVLERLLESGVPESHLRAGSIALQVRVENNQAVVLYENAKGELCELRAKAAVVSCPKFVAAKIMPDLESERASAIKKLRYRSYMTANLCLKKQPQEKFYDLFMTKSGHANLGDVKGYQDKVNATDLILANFAAPQFKGAGSVFTFYRAFPYDGARTELFAPTSYATYRKKFEQQISHEILPMLKLKQQDIVDLRLTLWGHALPLGAQGFYQDDTVEQLRKPHRDRVFFIEQDNWAHPSLQTGATESVLQRDLIKKVIT